MRAVAEALERLVLPDTRRFVIVVEARVEVPITTNGPVDVEPVGLERKLRFSVQALPFQ